MTKVYIVLSKNNVFFNRGVFKASAYLLIGYDRFFLVFVLFGGGGYDESNHQKTVYTRVLVEQDTAWENSAEKSLMQIKAIIFINLSLIEDLPDGLLCTHCTA